MDEKNAEQAQQLNSFKRDNFAQMESHGNGMRQYIAKEMTHI